GTPARHPLVDLLGGRGRFLAGAGADDRDRSADAGRPPSVAGAAARTAAARAPTQGRQGARRRAAAQEAAAGRQTAGEDPAAAAEGTVPDGLLNAQPLSGRRDI